MNEIKNCPFCSNDDIVYSKKQSLWTCQGCGKTFLDEDASRVARITDRAATPKAIFFSYGHDANRELVEKFKADLEKRGHTVWFDAKDIGAWDDWKGAITRGIDGSQMAIAFMSKHALRDPGVCRNEIAIALSRFGTVYPVAVETDVYDDIPVTIRHLQWPDLSQWQAIRDGNIPGEDWERWYEARLIELVEKIEGEASQFSGESRALRDVLQPSTFEAEFVKHLDGFVGREWVFEAFQNWLEHQPQSRLFWIKAGPGVGKTALAVNLAARERGSIVANWFCDAGSTRLRSPEQAIRTLAYQWALRWEDFRVRLLRQLGITANTTDDRLDEIRKELNKLNPEDSFRKLIVEPLANLIWREHKLVVVVDALDEATDDQGDNPLTDFIGSQMGSLPDWIGFVVTSRPDPAVVSRLQGFKPFIINAQDARNLADLRAWYDQNLAGHEAFAQLPASQQQSIADLLIERSEGMILYLKLVEEGLREKSLTVERLNGIEAGLPGLYAIYATSFQHRFGKDYETAIQPLVRLLVAADGPLPDDLACEVLSWNSEQFNKARLRLGSFVVESPAGIEPFHKTLREWMTHRKDNVFYVDPILGRQQIADILFKEISEKGRHAARWRELIRQRLTRWWPYLAQQSDAKSLYSLGLALGHWADFSQAEKLLREALTLRKATLPEDHPDIASSLNILAILLMDTGRLDEAEPLFREALTIRKATLPAEHPDIASSLNNLANLLNDTGRSNEAEPLYREALTIWKATLPAEHPDIAAGLINLASLLKVTGRSNEAETLYREALALWKTAQKEGHPDIASSLSGLANLLQGTSRSNEAEALYRQSLMIWKTALPAGHPDIASGLYNLAILLRDTGRLDEAEPLYREALALRKATLLSGHPHIATSLDKLASLLHATGRSAEAEPLYREALTILKAALPEGHSDTAGILNNLANLLHAARRFPEAESLYREALALRKTLPEELPDIAVSFNNLAILLADTRRFAEAEPLFREALLIRKAALPGGHPLIAASLKILADLLKATGHFAEAEPLYHEALTILKAAHPAGHSDTAGILNNLADLLRATGRSEETEPVYREALTILKAALPTGHPGIAASLNNLAILLMKTSRFDEAEPLFREALTIRKGSLPGRHPDISRSLNSLAASLAATGRFTEAEPLFREALMIGKATLPAGHPDIVGNLNNLARLLKATGRIDEAETLLSEALALRKSVLPGAS